MNASVDRRQIRRLVSTTIILVAFVNAVLGNVLAARIAPAHTSESTSISPLDRCSMPQAVSTVVAGQGAWYAAMRAYSELDTVALLSHLSSCHLRATITFLRESPPLLLTPRSQLLTSIVRLQI